MEFILQIGLVFLLVFLNGFFVASEFSLVAVRKTRIRELARKGNKAAKRVKKAIANLDTFISATQLGITLASLALGWIGEPVLAHFLEPFFSGFLPNKDAIISSHAVAITLAFSAITFLHIVLGELAPKTIALERAEKVSLFIISPLIIFTTIFKPFIWLLNGAGNLVLKLVGFKAPSGHQLVHSEEEIKMILAQSAEGGAIEKKEAEMVYSVLRLGDTLVKDIMIPVFEVVGFEVNTSLEEIIKKADKNPHSRFPVYKDNLDNVIGFIHIKDIYRVVLKNPQVKFITHLVSVFAESQRKKKLHQLKVTRNILKLSERDRIDDVLLAMRKKQTHIAVVRDKHGKTLGIVTLEDILENLVGDIHDEFEKIENMV